MRIIAGEFRGRRLLGPPSQTTRPITDRAKQSLFDILAPLIPGAGVYDCFAGTGSMGLECLSRGAANVAFFEADRPAAVRLRRNIQTLKLEKQSQVYETDLFTWFQKHPAADARLDLIFLDPPYRFLIERTAQLCTLADTLATGHSQSNATLIFRHDSADALTLPRWTTYDTRTYGRMMIELMRLA